MVAPLISPETFREIVSGRRRGLSAALLRGLLALAEGPYALEVQRRNRQFDTGKRAAQRVGVPVISVGNITLGGAGKTPMVEWIARWFRRRDVRVAILSRGYGAEEGACNDEALELEQKLPDVPHVQNPDRVAAALLAVEEFETQLILLDDGFQHRRIHRNLDIVLVDALEPFGFDHVFPRGLLREPMRNFGRADLVALTRADMVPAEERGCIRRRIERHRADVPWIESTHAPRSLLASDGSEQPLDRIAGKPVAAFCGIGNPAGFRHTLAALDCQVAAWREFPDHHNYSGDDVQSLSQWAQQAGDVGAVVCTQKDLVKIGEKSLGERPLFALAISMDIVSGQDVLEAALEEVLRSVR